MRLRSLLLALFSLALPLAAQGESRVELEAKFVPAKAAPGDVVTLELHGEIQPGYHLYGALDQNAEPPSIELAKSAFEKVGEFETPPGESHESFGVESYWVVGKAVFRQRLRVPANATPGELKLTGKFIYVACTEAICDPEATDPFSATLAVTKQEQDKKKGSPEHTDKRSKLRLRLYPETARPGEVVMVVIEAEIADKYHAYGSKQDPDLGPPFAPQLGPGVLVPEGKVDVPPGVKHEQQADLMADPLVLHYLEGKFSTLQTTRLPKGTKAGSYPVKVHIEYQICDDKECLDHVADLTASLVVEEGEARAAFTKPRNRDELGQIKAAGGDATSRLLKEGVWGFLLLAVGAGLFALIMPCTYPMIPITISFFTKQAEARGGKVLPLSLSYGAGIVAIFVLIGVIVGPAIDGFANHPVFNLAIGALFLVFALSLFGLYELRPPSFLMNAANKASSRSGAGGVFLMGLTLCVTSFTCTAPFVGTLLAAGAEMGFIYVILGMAVFGLTMALPFVALSLLPASLPRSGAWMNAAKVFFGFVEIAAALKFFSNAEYTWQLMILPRELFLMLWAIIFIAAGVYLLGMVRLKGETGEIGAGRLTFAVASILLGAYFGHGAMGYELKGQIMKAFEPPYTANVIGQAPVAGEGGKNGDGKHQVRGDHTIILDDFDRAVAVAKAEKKQLLLNITGFN